MLLSKCVVCESKKMRFIQYQKASALSACDSDTYFENIQTILIFLKYYKILFFFMNN